MARVLIIDDSLTVVGATRKILEAVGLEVLVLESFAELPRMMRQMTPDAVLLDLEIPGLSGETFGQYVRRCETRHTPIIIYSSQPTHILRAAARELDAEGVVEKGVPEDVLRTIVCDVIRNNGVREKFPKAFRAGSASVA